MRTAWLLIVIALSACAAKAVELVLQGETHTLRERPRGGRPSSPHKPPLLLLSLDGIPRELLYQMIRRGELPSFSALLGDQAYFDDTLLTAMPSTTFAAFTSAMTGVTPAVHGVAGNEYFIRETQTFACPAPISFDAKGPTLSIYTDRYLDKLIEVPTVDERMRRADPDVLIWATMNHVFRGADRLILAKRSAMIEAYAALLGSAINKTRSDRKLFTTIDKSAIETLAEQVGKARTLPDVITLYVGGTDLYAHVAPEGPVAAQRWYLRDVVDPALGRLVRRLRERGMLARMWTIIIADHGHTPVLHDDRHALRPSDSLGKILRAAGFRVRPAKQKVPDSDPSSAVVAYGGPTAYVYLADRTTCLAAKSKCTWKLPPRYREDVLVAAEALYRNNLDGSLAPAMKGTLDMVLTRKPKPFGEIDDPFEVYVGNGQTMPIEDYLAEHPHPTYIKLAERMHALAVGPHGERAGDIMLLTHDGDVDRIEQRFYFAGLYHSWHGSASRRDSEIPLVVAHHGVSRERIAAFVQSILGDEPYLWKVTDLLLALRR